MSMDERLTTVAIAEHRWPGHVKRLGEKRKTYVDVTLLTDVDVVGGGRLGACELEEPE